MPLGGVRSRLSLSLSLDFCFFHLFLSLSRSLSLSFSFSLSPSLSLSISFYPSLPLSLAHFVPVTVGAGSRATRFLFLGHGANRTGIFQEKPFCGHIGVCLVCVMFGYFPIVVFLTPSIAGIPTRNAGVSRNFCVLGA